MAVCFLPSPGQLQQGLGRLWRRALRGYGAARRFVWLPALLALVCGPALALDADYYKTRSTAFAEGDHWKVTVNLARKSCLLTMDYLDDSVVKVGGDNTGDRPSYFFLYGNPHLTFEAGEDFEVVVDYGGDSAWSGEGVGVVGEGLSGVAVERVKAAFLDDFAAAEALDLTIDGLDYGAFALTDGRTGVARLRECFQSIDDVRKSVEELNRALEGDDSRPTARPDDGAEDVTYSTGTGFFVNGDGYLLTNAHVVEGCGAAEVRRDGGVLEPATIVARDEAGDLALLRIEEDNLPFGAFRGAPPIRLGDTVVVFGYPLTDYLSKTGNLATGLVASLAGAGDDETQMQISAPVQSGNSGGAVVDQSGRIVGIVVAKSNIQSYEDDDDIEVIQNVNFAIKAGEARDFLDAHKVRYTVEPPGEEMKTPDVAEIARKFSAQVVCEVRK
ncbi:S1C family serine protease [Pleomorphomonas sp. JP5]|uniref:S1C family serine protease n=1 Tax=Pleomorphomonas sp. JP5 TaxID=2942998 RepID=UPI002044C008|nr:serine protease [Pleomorphomonas sp. JP5]MCM5557550.1 serine protease [Pleomorphomonas sp. JP5]